MNTLKPDKPTVNATTPNPWQWKFLNLLGVSIVCLACLGGLAWWEVIRPAIISYAANDYSDSALNYAKQREKKGTITQYLELCLTLREGSRHFCTQHQKTPESV